jgi:hypothetical protein
MAIELEAVIMLHCSLHARPICFYLKQIFVGYNPTPRAVRAPYNTVIHHGGEIGGSDCNVSRISIAFGIVYAYAYC